MKTNSDGGDDGGMTDEDRRIFVRAFFMISHEQRVEVLRDHGLVPDAGYVPSRKDERGAWYRTALTRAAKRGQVEAVRDDVLDLVRRQKHASGEAPEDVGIDPEAAVG